MENGNHTWWIAMVVLLPVLILIGGILYCLWDCEKKDKSENMSCMKEISEEEDEV